MSCVHLRENPFEGLAESVKTSNVVDLRTVEIWSWSWRTTSGTTENVTFQVSNGTGDTFTAPINAGFSDFTVFGTGAASVFTGPVGVRFGRFVRSASSASIVVDVSKIQR